MDWINGQQSGRNLAGLLISKSGVQQQKSLPAILLGQMQFNNFINNLEDGREDTLSIFEDNTKL